MPALPIFSLFQSLSATASFVKLHQLCSIWVQSMELIAIFISITFLCFDRMFLNYYIVVVVVVFFNFLEKIFSPTVERQ